jgi:guanine nucleotide-binding protein alpha-1 subunit
MKSGMQPNRRRRSHSINYDTHDPLLVVTQPPANESPEEREMRLRAERAAKERSEEIDEMLRAEKNSKKKKREVKVLLLGQSESGKSTTLKRESVSTLAWRFGRSLGFDWPRMHSLATYHRGMCLLSL